MEPRQLLKNDSRIERMETRSVTRKERAAASRKLRDVPARAMKISVVESEKKTKYMNPFCCRADGHAGKRPNSESLGPTNCKSKHEMKLDMTQRILRDVPARERKVSAVERNLNVETVDLTNEENQRKSRAAPSRERKISAVESKDGNSTKYKGCSQPKKGEIRQLKGSLKSSPRMQSHMELMGMQVKSLVPQAPSSTICKNKCEMNLDMVDHSYRSFLNSLKKDDLEAKIRSAQGNQPEILNLMRGFFYWLMNASHAGSRALRPWLDSSCLKVRPQHKKEIDVLWMTELDHEM
ncbi:hypothetical protein NC651_004691 [Populus alba x Populus x berolinensis]|nr:hypothetical protein NC651_004691 [Populus alba x Populus x berolinensis]